jgi:hypothetical protein
MSHEGNDFNIEAKKDEMEEVKNWKDHTMHDEFVQRLIDDETFASVWEYTRRDFYQWIDNYKEDKNEI